jgi:hypothetical protein
MLFAHLLVICTSLEKCLFRSFVHLLAGFFALLVFKFLRTLYILDINAQLDEKLIKIFSCSVGFLSLSVVLGKLVEVVRQAKASVDDAQALAITSH